MAPTTQYKKEILLLTSADFLQKQKVKVKRNVIVLGSEIANDFIPSVNAMDNEIKSWWS